MISHKDNKKIRQNKYLAEIIGIISGDGSIYLDKKRKYHTIICFNKKEAQYLSYVKELVENFFRYKFTFFEQKNEYIIRNVSVFVGTKLLYFGLKSGNKVKNKLEIPNWIMTNKLFLKRFIRGMFDTDGCVYRKYNRYAQIEIKLACKETIESLRTALIKLNFTPTKIQTGLRMEGKFYWKIYLARQKEVERFFNFIQPKNQKHVMRYKKIKDGATGI